jgi:hypothetical protein
MFLLKTIYQKISTVFRSHEPSAAQIWQAKGKDVSHMYWMYATPVNMQLGRDSYFLSDPAIIAISQEESLSLIESLNTHFADSDYSFYLVGDVWLMGLNSDPKISTTHIKHVMNQDVANHLPLGEGALFWNKLQNEIQMLLYHHSVNQVRESKGLPVINSLWCYGLSQTS